MPAGILPDLMMPAMDRIQFRAEQERNPKFSPIPVVIMTADRHIEANLQKANVQAFIRKPTDIENF